MATPTLTDRVSRWATEIPSASRVFMRHQVDYCCGGARSFREACESVGADAQRVAEEIQSEEAATARREQPVRWDQRPLAELVDHIVSAYHRPLDEELPRLETMMGAVLRAHRDKDPERLEALADVLDELFTDLRDHLRKEEDTIFPWVRRGAADNAGITVTALVADHETAAVALQQIRILTDTFAPPPDACGTWRAFYAGLEAFDRTLRQHVHLENNVLFPRALGGEEGVGRLAAASGR